MKMWKNRPSPCCPARLFLAAWGLVFLCSVALRAQSAGGTIRGQVQDSSGGVIAGAEVRVLDSDKGIAYQTLSDSSGLYQVTVPVGRYEMEVSADGFTTTKEVGIALSLGQTWTTDFVLPVGTVRETMEVRAEMPLLDTASGTISELVDRERLEQLPLNGRDYGFLVLLQPGVVPNHNGANPTPFGGRWSNFLVNGQIDQATLFLIDGSDINDVFAGRTPSGSSGLLLGMDAVQEFQVLLNNYRAEFGRNSGGVVHVVTRSGSNQLRGSLFEYLRNSALDAKNFFDLPDEPIPPFRRNQFGASLGGPIRRDQTFFLLDYEGLRERKGLTSVAIVPTAGARSGAVEAVRPFLNAYPLPNERNIPAGARTASFTSSATQQTNEDFGLARVDHRLASHTTLFGRVSVQDSFAEQPFPSTPVPGFPDEVLH
ncbi:MAG: carboxypeptidase regulatory-like domain-containing protein, partial [Acidobacteria bacterium]|nr:carboxypeptidase regulatory-like domain-containing protein [Acidobacteriota bacterium]